MNPRLVILLLFILALLLCLRARATEFFVTNLQAFNATVPLLRPGDMVTLANGTWSNVDLVFTGQGTASKPITLRAETGGRVLLSGSSRLHLAGQYLVARGLFFTNGYPRALDAIEFQAAPYGLATNCQVTDCAIVDFNHPTDTTSDTKWVSLYGFSNHVDHCSFKGKRNNGTLMVVWLPPPTSPDATRYNDHRIDHNYFGQRPLNDGNGGEILRVGDSTTSFNLSGTVVEQNCFEDCDGEIEVISNKSSENVYRYNTFRQCAGTLTLRHGNGCWVEGNCFFGAGRPSTGGVRVLGEDHTVINNYFQDLTGSAGYSAIVLMQGLPDSPLNGYFQVQNAVIAFNTVVNCAHSLLVGLEATYSQGGSNVLTSLPPLNCTMANNIVFATQNELVDQRTIPINLTWQGNIMFGTPLGLPPTPGILVADPRVSPGPDGLWRPATDGPAFGAAQGSYGYVTDDIRGRLRPATKDLGCVEVNASSPTRSVVTSADVGSAWLHPLTLSLTLRTPTVASLRWQGVSGAVYQVQSSTNLVQWTNASAVVTTIGATQLWEESLASSTSRVPVKKSYRLKQLINGGPLRAAGSPDGSAR